MQISAQKVVSIDYTLTNDKGEVVDTSQGHEPLVYIQGIGNLIPGLEQALEGRAAGDTLQVSVSPEQAYGDRDAELTQAVPRKMFENADEIQVGMQFQTMSEHGHQVVTVIGVDAETITVDANHPLAGETLHFDVKVIEVRDATPEELDHGHVHGEGGHHH
ncbi:MAG TPA: peptidylprolyl isomerase [Gammaproteobacteria bacterium]